MLKKTFKCIPKCHLFSKLQLILLFLLFFFCYIGYKVFQCNTVCASIGFSLIWHVAAAQSHGRMLPFTSIPASAALRRSCATLYNAKTGEEKKIWTSCLLKKEHHLRPLSWYFVMFSKWVWNITLQVETKLVNSLQPIWFKEFKQILIIIHSSYCNKGISRDKF